MSRVDVIDEFGKKLGIMETFQARKLADEKGLDLVEITVFSGYDKPSLVKIMDYGKHLYEKEKRSKQGGGKKSKEQEIKEIRFGYRIDIHDLRVRAEKVDKFLKEGHKVVVGINLRGRELGLAHLAKEKLNKFLSLISMSYQAESEIKRQPRGWNVILVPSKK